MTSLMNSFNTSNVNSGETLPSLMFGLLSCPIPVVLKGDILNLLASLSLNPLMGVNMWQLLENSQILPTATNAAFLSSSSASVVSMNASSSFLGGGGGFGSSGPVISARNDIKSELEEVESRDESYPLLRGFLRLLRTLLTHTTPQVPDNLGLGLRPKSAPLGFQPYLNFLINHVYLKFLFRSYKSAHEKWLVCADLLHIFYQLVARYQLDPLDFQQQSNIGLEPNAAGRASSAGFRLIHELIHDGPLVKMLFAIVNECLAHLLEYNASNDRAVEISALMCLRLVEAVIRKQRAFVELMREANMNVENTGVEKLIVAINPKTNR